MVLKEFKPGPDGDDLEEVRVVLGYNASLPCSVPSPAHDAPYLTLWYIDKWPMPVYSYDERPGNRGVQWADERVFGSRAEYLAHSTPPALVLAYVTEQDAKLYRCRVDFQNTNSRVTWVNLTVIVPPSRSEIIPRTSPVRLGDRNDVICKAFGGSPTPQVMWLQQGMVVDSTFTHTEEETYNVLEVEATRQDLYSPFYCRVTNNDLTGPPDVQYLRNVTCSPLTVTITGGEEPISEGRTSTITCIVTGSNPHPMVTWYQEGHMIKPLHAMVTERDNITKSVLTLNATRSDHGRQLLCRAYNQLIPEDVREDVFTMDVAYKPRVNMTLGRTLDSSNLREGSDFFFECEVDANPKPYKVEWRLNGALLIHNVTAGVLVSESTLALQKVSRERSGDYLCSASNVQGDTESHPFHIEIKYAPRCTVNPTLIGVGLFESLNISCLVEADPPVVSFSWTFNNSIRNEHNKVIRPNSYSTEELRSVLTYTPRSDRDYGTLLCRASNDVGIQSTPCSFTVISAGPPEEVIDCVVENITTHSCNVSCTPAFNGGLPQHFLLEIWHLTPLEQPELITNQTNLSPTFFVQSLSPGESYEVRVTALNAKGSSSKVIMPLHTEQEVELQQTLPSRSQPSAFMFVLGVIGGALLVVVLILLVGITTWMISNHRRRRPAETSERDLAMSRDRREARKNHKKESNPDVIDVITPTSSTYSDMNTSVMRSQNTYDTELDPSPTLTNLDAYGGSEVIVKGREGGGKDGGVEGGNTVGGGCTSTVSVTGATELTTKGGGGTPLSESTQNSLTRGGAFVESNDPNDGEGTRSSVHRRVPEQGPGITLGFTEPIHLPIQRGLQNSTTRGPDDDLYLLQKSLRGLSSLHHPL